MKIPTRKILPAIASLKAPGMFSKTSRILHRLAVDGMGQDLERRLQISYLLSGQVLLEAPARGNRGEADVH